MSTSSRKDIEVLKSAKNKSEGAVSHIVAASATIIYPGDIVVRAGGTNAVSLMATNKPALNADYVQGIAVSVSTNTASVAGSVMVQEVGPDDILLISPNAPTSWDTQAEYDALVGDRVLIDLTVAKYTILASDSADSGCLIRSLDISKYPGKVAFSFRGNLSADSAVHS